MTNNVRCSLCGSNDVLEFLRRTGVSIHQNLLVTDQKQAREINNGSLCMCCCKDCGFIFNRCFDPGKLSYNDHYDNSQTYSSYFTTYLQTLADRLLEEKKTTGSTIVEVGCGKGEFLRLLVSDPAKNNIGYGFDPSYVGPETDLNNRLHFRKRFYERDCAGVQPDVVICRHVLEHVPDPIELLFSIRSAINESNDAKVYFETPCVEWILENTVIWDFFYEHCSLFTASSLTKAFQTAGFHVESVEKIFGGQYLWIEAVPGQEKISGNISGDTRVAKLASEFAAREQELIMKWQAETRKLAEHGKLAVWGAGAKGATFSQLVDPECQVIDCIIDLNPHKQGKFLPGSGHPIVGIHGAGARNITHALLLNPNYFEENRLLLEQEQMDLTLILAEL